MNETSKLNEQLEQAVCDLRAIAQKKDNAATQGKSIVEYQQQLDKAAEIACNFSALTSKILDDRKQTEIRENELMQKMESLERSTYRRGEKPPIDRELNVFAEKYNKIFSDFIRYGVQSISAEDSKYLSASNISEIFSRREKQYLRTDANPDGGFLIPPEYTDEIIKDLVEISPVRTYAKIRETISNEYRMPSQTSKAVGFWTAEGESAPESKSTYGREAVFVHSQTVRVKASREALQDSPLDIESSIMADASEEFARMEGEAFLNGNGVKRPEGLLSNTRISKTKSGKIDDIDFNSMTEMIGKIKKGYNPRYTFNRQTEVRLMLLNNGVGDPLWTPGNVTAGFPNRIRGYEYFISNDMPDIGASQYPVLFGDFSGYLIVDRLSISLIRDEYTDAEKRLVRFIFHRRVGGQPTQAEKFTKLQCAV